MAKCVFLFLFFYATYGLSVLPVPSAASTSEMRYQRMNLGLVRAPSSTNIMQVRMRLSSKSWTTPEEVVPQDYYDIPRDQRSPDSDTELRITLDDLYGDNGALPDYSLFGEGEDEIYPDDEPSVTPQASPGK